MCIVQYKVIKLRLKSGLALVMVRLVSHWVGAGLVTLLLVI